MGISDKCSEVAHNALNLYNETHYIYDQLATGEVPADYVFKGLEDTFSLYYTSAKGFLTEAEFHDLRSRLQDVVGHLPAFLPQQFTKLRGVERYTRLEHSRNDADRLVDKVADIIFQKIVECECKGR